VGRAKKKYCKDIAIVEDCAHAFGGSYKGISIGGSGNFCCFSFQAIKHLTCGDCGALCVPEKFYDEAVLRRWYGIDRNSNRKDFRCEADIAEWGYKMHMNDINATIGMANMEHVDGLIESHVNNAKTYDRELSGVEGVSLLERKDGFESSFWIYSMLVENREGFYSMMERKGIACSQVHARNDIHSCVRGFRSEVPALDVTVSKVVSVPVGWWLNDKDIEYIVESVKGGW
jgi:dTDP-4-amino-4,6-dideoxygalactose transaminase